MVDAVVLADDREKARWIVSHRRIITDKNNTQGDKNWFKFNDIPTLQNVKFEITGKKEVRISLDMLDGNGKSLYRQCYAPDTIANRKPVFYNMNDRRGIFIFGNGMESGSIQLQIPPAYNSLIQQTSKIELSIVSAANCT
jgi:hypothetical protein